MEIDTLSEPDTPSMPEHNEVERRLVEDARVSPIEGLAPRRVEEIWDDTRDVILEHIEAGTPFSTATIESPETRAKLGLKSKLDGPITPPTSAEKQRIQIDTKPAQGILASIDLPKLPTNDSTDLVLPGELNDGLIKIANAALQKLETKLVHERVQDIDVAMKCFVPKVNSTRIVPPWEPASTFPLGGGSKPHGNVCSLIRDLSDGHLLRYNLPSNNPKSSNLKWTVFSGNFGKHEVDENIEGDNNLPSLLPNADHRISSGDQGLLCEPTRSRLRQACDSDSNSELLPVDDINPLPTTSSNQAPKRKRHKAGTQIIRSNTDDSTTLRQPNTCPPGSIPPNISGPDSPFSALDSLSAFMKIRGKIPKRPRLETCPYFSKAELSGPAGHPRLCESSAANTHTEPTLSMSHRVLLPQPYFCHLLEYLVLWAR